MKLFFLLAFTLAWTASASEPVRTDRCSPKGYDICQSAKNMAEGITKAIRENKDDFTGAEIRLDRLEAKGILVTTYIVVRHTRAELEKIQDAKGETIDSYMGMLDSAAHRSNCQGPSLNIIAYGGIFRNVYTLSDGEHLTQVTISDCSAYVKE